ISGWRILWSRLNPFATPTNVPSIFATILRSVELYEVHQQRTKRALADVFIYPPVASFSTLDFDRREQLIEMGYEAARAELGAWLAAPERQMASSPS
ncbi:MAG TPA: hypothetical protein VEZ12_14010, partial [Herpetosiphonaceae bacterium]|nr:hypothetical protein [Herpetosiphonaceae bacterium]